MFDNELEKIVGKLHTLEALRRARERVRQLERELGGEPARPEEPRYVPEFLRSMPGLEAARGPMPGVGRG